MTSDVTVEPVRKALIAALGAAVKRAEKAPLDEVPGILVDIVEMADSSRRTLSAVRGLPATDRKTGPFALPGLETIQPYSLSGMLNGITETVGTEAFQEMLALARAWLKVAITASLKRKHCKKVQS